MIFRKLGKTDIMIPVIGQGTTGAGPQGHQTMETLREDTLRRGIECGMTLLDTGEHYDQGHAETIVARVIRGIRHQVIISSKFSPDHNSYDHILRAAEGSLQRMRTDYIDLYQVQWPNPTVPLEETIDALIRLYEQGKIRAAGVGNFSLWELEQAQQLSDKRISSIQVEYNLCNRLVEQDIIPFCAGQGITVIAYSPFSQGRQSFSQTEHVLLKRLADKYGVTIWQIILAWLMANPTLAVITRSMNNNHLMQNAAAADLQVSAEDLNEISSNFIRKAVSIDPRKINLLHSETPEPSWIYQNLTEAMENRLNLKPSPMELAEEIKNRGILKPIEVKTSHDLVGHYDLIHGQIRYWGWIIAFGYECLIPANILQGTRL